jgi:hypothetical protein
VTRPALCALLALVAWTGCKKAPREPRLVFTRKVGDLHRLFVAAPATVAEPAEVLIDVPGDLVSPRAILGGRALLFVAREPGAPRGDVWRLEANVVLEKPTVVVHDVPGRLLAASDDGQTLLTSDGEALWLVQDAATRELGRFLWLGGADLSADGARGVVAAMPRTCAADPAVCPVDLWAIDPGADAPLRMLRAGGNRANYAPSFVPGTRGGEVSYMSTAGDDSAACAARSNNCRHDTMKISWDGAEPALVRRGPAVAPAWSPDGRALAWMTNDEQETGCRSVVCDTMSIYLSRSGDEDQRLVTANASNQGRLLFSPDGRWLSYVGRDGKTIEVVKTDGDARRTLGAGADRAWVR